MLWRLHPMTHNDIIATMSVEIQLNCRFVNFYNKCKSHESQLVQTIIMMAFSNPMFPVGTNIRNAHKYDLFYNQWLLHRHMIVDDVNIIRELIDVSENYKSRNVLTVCNVDFISESMCIN